MSTAAADKECWYAAGLTFACTQCGNCCTGAPGYVWFDAEEAEAIAAHLQLDVDAFRGRYARQTFGRWTLDERRNAQGQYDCVFLVRREQVPAACRVYPVRPRQCLSWPFWPENLRSASAWRRASSTCPGMARGLDGHGSTYTVGEIRTIRDRTPRK